MKAFVVIMKGMGEVRLLASYNKQDNFKFYLANRLGRVKDGRDVFNRT